MRKLQYTMMCVAVLVTAAGQVQAGFISTVDQQNLGGTNSISGSVFQTFVPTLTGIDAAEFELRFGNPALPPVVSLRIYDGAGSLGALTLLAETDSQAMDSNYASFVTYHFDFASTVPLTPGNTYTLALANQGPGGSLPIGRITQNDNYTPGMAVLSNGSPAFSSDNDFVFTTGLHASPVPEPASMALWGIGTLGMGVMVRRRNRKQTELSA